MTDSFNPPTITFEFEHAEGARALLEFGTPVSVGDDEWRCPFHFVGFSSSKVRWITGADAPQAVGLAIRTAMVVFSTLDEVKNGTVRWLGTDTLKLEWSP